MSCVKTIPDVSAGSDIAYTWRYKDYDNAYPSISDATARFKGVHNDNEIFDISIGNPTTGTKVTLENDAKGDYLAIHIAGTDTAGLSGDLTVYSVVDSAESGRRTEALIVFELCYRGDL